MRRSVKSGIVSLGVLAIVVAGCGGDDESGSPAPAESATAPSASAAAPTEPVSTAASPTAGEQCSSDNSPTEVAVAPGPAPVIAVDADSAGNALPDLAVRRLNCGAEWVNLKNEIPAERPLLVWFWAPY